MSIGATMNTGISVRSPSAKNTHSGNNNFDDVELGTNSSSPSQGNKRRSLKAKESDVELTPLVIGNGDGSNNSDHTPARVPTTPRTPRGGNSVSGEGERSSTMKSIIASAMYSGCSVGMVLVNKSLASRYVSMFCYISSPYKIIFKLKLTLSPLKMILIYIHDNSATIISFKVI